MGQIVPRSASADRIVDDYTQSLSQGRARGGTVKERVEARLGEFERAVADNQERLQGAQTTALRAHDELVARDAESDLEVGAVLDECWNALGRPAQSVAYTTIAGRGKAQWTDGDPAEQHVLLQILENNIRATTIEPLVGRKDGWANRIKARAAAQQAAAVPVKAADAAVEILRGYQRALANLIQIALVRLKRDFKNDGMTEHQIHEIIPDYVPQTRPRPAPPA